MASVLGLPMRGLDRRDLRLAQRVRRRSPRSALVGAAWVWRVHARRRPAGGAVAAPPGSEVFTHPVLMAIVLVTALSGAGQFTLFSYFAPYFRRRARRQRRRRSSLLFVWFGVFGLIGNVLLSRYIDRIGADARGDVRWSA